MKAAVMFSKATDEWETPQDFFDALDAEFHFEWDMAANPDNAKCLRYFSKDGLGGGAWDALAHDWSEFLRGPGWCNPPYSQCAKFLERAAQQARKGVTTVMLIPSRTDTRYWHLHIWDAEKHAPRPGVEIRFIKGRLKFGNSTNSAPFPSVVIIFRPVPA